MCGDSLEDCKDLKSMCGNALEDSENLTKCKVINKNILQKND